MFGIKILSLCALLLGSVRGQTPFHLNGYLRDATTGETVIGAQVMDSLSGAGAITNAYGYFALSLKQPHAVLRVQMAGYQSIRLAMQLRGDTTLSIELPPFQTETVVIEDDAALTPSQAQVLSVPVRQLTKIPMPGGEPDVLKGLILLPGVSGGTEGSTGLYVRGGTPDQNLILLDGAPVYNVSHLFSFVSVFNGDAVKDVQLYKGGFPARYGGRLASVINITTKEGNSREHHQSIGVSPVAGRALFEGPLGKGSYMVAARASMAGLAMLPIYLRYIRGKSVEYQNYWLYDLNTKYNRPVGKNGHFYASIYAGTDDYTSLSGHLRYSNGIIKEHLNWGNNTLSLRYTYLPGSRWFLQAQVALSAYHNRYQNYLLMRGGAGTDTLNWAIRSNITRLRSAQANFSAEYQAGVRHTLSMGAELSTSAFVQYTSGDDLLDDQPAGTLGTATPLQTFRADGYLSDVWRITDRWQAEIGLRIPTYFADDTSWIYAEPRINTRWKVGKSGSITASYSYMNQFLHLISSTTLGLPTDVWYAATRELPPQHGHQLAAGYQHFWASKKVKVNVDGFYKDMTGQVEWAQLGSIQNPFATGGTGRVYGAELLLSKESGKLTGWLGYTLMFNTRQFPNINNGLRYPARFDRRHDFEGTGSYHFAPRWQVSATWVYATGNTSSVPIAMVPGISGGAVPVFVGRNNYRLPPSHRLDVSLIWDKKTKRGRAATWSFGCYNAYNRANPFYAYLMQATDGNGNISTSLKIRSLSFIIPFVNYALTF